MKILMLLICLSFVSSLSAEKHRKGKFTLQEGGIPRSYYEDIKKRWKGVTERIPKGERIAIETVKGQKYENVVWDVIVPETYDPTIPIGVLSYITPGSPKYFTSLLEKYNLISISAKNSSNSTIVFARMSMALWGLDKLKELYNIDSNRLFVSGTSGGGRVSSITAALYPEIYKGAIYQCGVNFWHHHMTIGFMPGHEPGNLKLMRKNYFSFLTGDKDYNLKDTKSVLEKYGEAKIKNTQLIVHKNHGHKMLPTEVLDQALAFIDSPRVLRGKEAFEKGMSALKRKRSGEAFKYLQNAAGNGHQQAIKEFKKLNKDYLDRKSKIVRLHEEKDYVEVAQLISSLSTVYGKEMAKEEEEYLKQYRKDPAIVKEFKAFTYFVKIKAALKKKGTSKDKIKTALNKILDQCPDTKTAEKAQKLLDTL